MSGKDGDMEICVFQIDHDKLDLRPDLRHNLFKCKHPGLADRYPERAEGRRAPCTTVYTSLPQRGLSP